MDIKINKKEVGYRIKKIRTSRRYTLEEFGEMFKASKVAVHRWENGQSIPNKERLEQISKFAGSTINELLYGSVEEFVRENYDQISKTKKVNDKTFELRVEYLLEEQLKLSNESLNINNLPELITVLDEIINKVPNDIEEFQNNLFYFISKLNDSDTALLVEFLIKQLDKYNQNDKDTARIDFIKNYAEYYLK